MSERITERQLEVLVAVFTSQKTRGQGARACEIATLVVADSKSTGERLDRLCHWQLIFRDGNEYRITERAIELLELILRPRQAPPPSPHF